MGARRWHRRQQRWYRLKKKDQSETIRRVLVEKGDDARRVHRMAKFNCSYFDNSLTVPDSRMCA